MTWKCPVCGYENLDDALFCIQCGTKKPDNIQQLTVPQQVTEQSSQSANQTTQAPKEQSIQQPTILESQSAQANNDQNQSSQQGTLQATQATASQSLQSVQNAQQVLQTQASTGKYYIIFIATPVSALNKSKLPLDFDVFESISIGRSPENVIVIPDPEISRRHAIISLEKDKLYIEDLNSTNGTYIYDGKIFQPIKGKQEIRPGSIIKLGSNTILKIVIE
ncbi:MAG: FHA domain-containing protein [Acidianus infernus]|uniref:FHA domain-containing protein n=1 Tax=Acidianus infernus TaxID=12915 RepID=UPI0022766892|nr:FHA domain-containing protein [Acidianus infernus]MCY0883907.1 FHA domain-containing protein [Acidianus infernus]